MKTIPSDANPPVRLMMRTTQLFDQPQPDWLIQAPGREMWVAARQQAGYEYEVYADDFESSARFSHRSAKTGHTVLKRPLPDWARYPAGVIAVLGDRGMDIPAFYAIVLGDEPSGPRYSFGMGVVFAMLCYVMTNTSYTDNELISTAEQVRRTYIK